MGSYSHLYIISTAMATSVLSLAGAAMLIDSRIERYPAIINILIFTPSFRDFVFSVVETSSLTTEVTS